MILRWGAVISTAMVLAACSSPDTKQKSRYSQKYDSAPSRSVDVSRIPDATPKYEERKRAGNKSPYQVFGKTYYVMPESTGFSQKGVASWYGTKFHGHLTSNGERYDMYEMTAAHKTLPIPSYVRVVNKDNGREVVVRVNDRGPFHGGRIIDLSYAAAIKLGYQNKGTANVEIFALEPDGSFAGNAPKKQYKPTSSEKMGYVQLAAFTRYQSALDLHDKVKRLSKKMPVVVQSPNNNPNVYRVRFGPSQNERELKKWAKWAERKLDLDVITVWE